MRHKSQETGNRDGNEQESSIIQHFDSLVDRKHDRKHGGKVRCGLKEYSTFMQGFFDEFVLLVIQFHYGLTQVSNPSMHEFRGF